MPRRDREQSGTETATDVSLLYRTLANKYRRAIIQSLDETHTPVPRKALTTYVSKEIFTAQTRADFIEFRDQVRLKLQHIHLPLLADADIIEIKNKQIQLGTMFAESLAVLAEFPGGFSDA